jgi:spore coat polysaccharide biosynthesis predicted glycosyltransferase SpsG
MNITLICKGGVNTGLGHLHRAVSFVESAREHADFNVVAIIDKGLEVLFKEIPDTVFIYKDQELTSVIKLLKDDGGFCIIDMIELDQNEQQFIRNRYKKIISLSPVFNNYDILDYVFTRFNEHNYPSHIKVFSGLQYAIFNTHCARISDEVYNENLAEKQLTVGISMGGVDAPNKTLIILEALAKIEQDCTFWVLLGEGYSHSYQDIVDTIRRDSNHEIVLAKSNRSMWKILSNCSLAIFAGGLTSFEAIYAGLPAINIFEKEIHQSIISKEIIEKNVSLNLGVLNDRTLLNLQEKISSFYNNRNLLLEMRENTKGLLDKNGSIRTINKIKEIIKG